jgi:hypothetical protein
MAQKPRAVLQTRLLVGKTGYPCYPLLSCGSQPGPDPVPAVAALDTGFGSQIDAQERMPALRPHLAREPGRIPAPISQHQHPPLGGDHAIELSQQRLPLGLPGSLLIRREHLSGHENGTAAHQHADTQHGEALSQGRRIQFLVVFRPPR